MTNKLFLVLTIFIFGVIFKLGFSYNLAQKDFVEETLIVIISGIHFHIEELVADFPTDGFKLKGLFVNLSS